MKSKLNRERLKLIYVDGTERKSVRSGCTNITLTLSET